MTYRSLLLGFPMLSLACGALQSAPETASVDLGMQSQELEVKTSKRKAKQAKNSAEAATVDPRRVGDYYVHQFSGSFRQGPLTLTERIVGRNEDTLVIDYTLQDGETDKTLRVEFDAKSETPLKVSEVSDSGLAEVPLATYEAMLEQTIFVPDVNEELLAKSKGTCLVGPKELACETKRYRVLVGDDEATLSITHSRKMPGRDIAGEVTAVDGSVIYRAELLDAGHTPHANDSVAQK
jgi:hypothetical protein